jgi:TonB family protein
MGSAAIHTLVVALMWLSSVVQPRPMEFITFEFELVAPSAPERPPEEEPPAVEEELVVETPEPPPPEPEPDPVVEEVDPEPEPEELRAPPPDPAPTPSSPEEINVRMEGLRRDFPVYYQNIVDQINRCFRPGNRRGLETRVSFVIERDGTVSREEIVESSGVLDFDLDAVAAVECAGGRFGPLPADLPYDQLPVLFRFQPRGQGPEVPDRLMTPAPEAGTAR